MAEQVILIMGQEAVAHYEVTGKIPSETWLHTHDGEVLHRSYLHSETFEAVAEIVQKMAGQDAGVAISSHEISDEDNPQPRFDFLQKLKDLSRQVADELCAIPEYPEELFPRTVFVEVEDPKGDPTFRKYKLISINQATGTCLLEEPETQNREEFMLTAIETDWLIDVWYCVQTLISENKESNIAEANIGTMPVPKFTCPICRGENVACDARINPNTGEILSFFDDWDASCRK